MGLQVDTHLKANQVRALAAQGLGSTLDSSLPQYQWLGSIFYLGKHADPNVQSNCGSSSFDRLSRLGVPSHPAYAASAPREVHSIQHRRLGRRSVLHGCR